MQVDTHELVTLTRSVDDIHISLAEMRDLIRQKECKSTEKNEVYAALAKAQAEMSLAGEDNINPFHKSKYANLADFIKASRPALTKNGLCVIHQIITKSDGRSVMRTILGHTSGQSISSTMTIAPAKNDIQSIGSYITYLKRYMYAALIGAVAGSEDDDGEMAVGRGKPQIVHKQFINDNQLKMLKTLLSDRPAIYEMLLDKHNLEFLDNLPATSYETVLAEIQKAIRELE